MPDATQRFSSRVPYYHRARPRYPQQLIASLQQHLGLASDWHIADLGAGTGLSAEPFLDLGCTVFAIEPNPDMLAEAVRHYGERTGFHARQATAEATALPDDSVDLVIAGQAFHWFDIDATRRECRRILKPGGKVALFWNERDRAADSPFMTAYNELVKHYDTDGNSQRTDQSRMAARRQRFFEQQAPIIMPNPQVMDWEIFHARLLSSSYMPLPDHPAYPRLLSDARELFAQYQVDGAVTLYYQTALYIGDVR